MVPLSPSFFSLSLSFTISPLFSLFVSVKLTQGFIEVTSVESKVGETTEKREKRMESTPQEKESK